MKYNPALDALRGVSIIGVFLFHVHLAGGGWIGVTVFFTLSGFLITSILLNEHEMSGRIDLRDFYRRRALRLLPALFALIAVYWIYGLLFQPLATDVSSLAALFYVTNWTLIYGVTGLDGLSHTWSLAIEEHFYMIWPLILLLLLNKRSSLSKICLFLLAVILVLYLNRLFLGYLRVSYARIYYGSDTRADAIFIGCLLAVATKARLINRRFKTVALFLSPFSLAAIVAMYFFTPSSALCLLLTPWLAAIVIISPPRALTIRPLTYLGRISYGFYLWHELLGPSLHHLPLTYFISAATVASLSFHLIESPFLKLKDRRKANDKISGERQTVRSPAATSGDCHR
jgi:peptidoglycan/LPS O-acetylase OafA/YrhL